MTPFQYLPPRVLCLSTTCCLLLLTGCENNSTERVETDASNSPPVQVAPAVVEDASYISVPELREKLKIGDRGQFEKVRGKIRVANLLGVDVADISPLKGLQLQSLDLTNNKQVSDISTLEGMPLLALYLEGTSVTDLTPLEGMPLENLWLGHCQIEDISPLAGMQLKELNLFNTRVKDISVVADMPLNTLWLKETAVTDLSVIKDMTLQSLDINGTEITDLTPIAEMRSLQRLNIANSKVTDLSALKKLRLQRLVFTPAMIKTGMEVVRDMKSLRQIGTTFDGTPNDDVQPAAQFWASYDAKQKP